MFKKYKLFSYKLNKDSDFIEIGGGEGDLSKNLIYLKGSVPGKRNYVQLKSSK